MACRFHPCQIKVVEILPVSVVVLICIVKNMIIIFAAVILSHSSRPKRPAPSLIEFYEDEKENQVTRQIIQGHNRYN